MSHLSALKSATDIHDIASILGFKASAVSYILYKKDAANKYRKFEIAKRSGGTRQILAPAPDLKLLQKRLSDVLQHCTDEINQNNNYKDQISHGFKPNRSIITNATKHRNRRYVFNIDLTDFFGSFNFGRVRGFFIADRNFSFNSKIATIIAQIACHENSLPQGSPASPIISNLIGHVLDIHLVRLASQDGCTYTRYADDLTFSTNKKDFPKGIAVRSIEDENTWLVGTELARLIRRCGFQINALKTRLQYCDSRQEVTGLVVNRKINVRTEYRRTVRAMVHHLFTKGSFDFVSKEVGTTGVVTVTSAPGKIEKLHGMLGFIDGIDLYNRAIQKEMKAPKDNLSTKESMYRRFLLFKDFYAAPKPVIICEGKTDNIYIRYAIRSLALAYPQLATVSASGSPKRKIRLYKYAGTSTGRIIGINGGTGELSKFIRSYDIESRRFKAPAGENPVILLVDNDSGARGKNKIFNTVESVSGTVIKGTEQFVHITSNLYLVATPLLPGSSESMIEDFFDVATKSIKIGGKDFDAKNEIDTASSYGKHIFAQKVIKVHADKIDFSGFHSLLTNIVAVIDAHEKKCATSVPVP